MLITIQFSTSNAAFRDEDGDIEPDTVAEVINAAQRELARRLSVGGVFSSPIFDTDGNPVGTVRVDHE